MSSLSPANPQQHRTLNWIIYAQVGGRAVCGHGL
jgi:hypothetical protein